MGEYNRFEKNDERQFQVNLDEGVHVRPDDFEHMFPSRRMRF